MAPSRSLKNRKSTTTARPSQPANTPADIQPLWGNLSARESIIISLAIVAVVTLLTFSQAPNFDFVNFDDSLHVYDNPYFRTFDIRQIGHFWQHPYGQLYIPISYTVFGLLTQIAHRPPGFVHLTTTTDAPLDPNVFHTANLFLHVVNVLMVFFVLRRLTRRDLPSIFGALVFGIHPLQVESVAWISELRGLLGATFSLAAFHLYLDSASLRGQDKRKWLGRSVYALSVLLSICAVLSKPSYVTDCVLIAALGIFACGKSWKRAIFEALPFVPAGLAILAVTSVIQMSPAGQIVKAWQCPFIVGDTLSFYLEKILLPIALAADYGRKPTWVLSHWWAYAIWIVPTTVAIFLYRLRTAAPYLIFGAAVFVGSLLPVLGIAPFTYQRISTTADRYVYLAMLGVAIIVAFGLKSLPIRLQRPGYAIAAAWLVALCVLTFRQTSVWRNSLSLFSHSLAINPDSAVAQNNLGQALERLNQISLAEEHYRRAVELDPTSKLCQTNLGGAYAELGDSLDAERHFRAALALSPHYSIAHRDLGILLLTENRPSEGAAELQLALRFDPTEYVAAQWLGEHDEKVGDYTSAIAVFSKELKIRPDVEPLWRKLGLAYYAAGRKQEAVQPLETALRLDPSDTLAASALQSIQGSPQPAS